ncbi:MAG: anti-sigma factor antagonist [Defluviitaleaceae bacterium]|nr:anti-sigma factor antagonist [Defluviitaleaceae bacterium]MCL2263976.1 anti-sigma factor antagonist [Defluviitaleaceae bacterium]
MQININGKVLFATLDGELDYHMAEKFRTQLDAAFEKSACRHILLDMSDVSFMDSSGIGMVIGRYKKAELRGGRLVLAGMSESLAKLYEMSGLSKIVSRAATNEAAISMLGGPLV